jgi:integrase
MPEGEKPKRKPKRQRRERGRLHTVQHKNGVWYIKGTVRGVAVDESTGLRDFEAADAIRVKREKELLDEAVHGKVAVTTFAEAYVNYIKSRPDGGGSMAKHFPKLLEDLGDKRCSELTNKFVRDYAIARCPDLKGCSRNAIVIEPVRAVLRRAAFDELCAMPAIETFPNDRSKVKGAPPKVVEEFISRCSDVRLRTFVALIRTTGCRAIDALRLRSEDIDYDVGTALFRKTKNGNERSAPVAALLALFRSFEHDTSGTVFPWRDARHVNGLIETECKRLGLPYFSTHKLGRHAFAEANLAEGRTTQEVAKMGGWDDPSVVARRYGHLEKGRLDAEVRDKQAELMRKTLRVVGGKD